MEEKIAKVEPVEVEKFDFTADEIQLIKDTVARGTDDLQFKLFLYQARAVGLNPLAKQIHAVLRYNQNTGKQDMAIQTGIDGYRLIAARTGCYAGSDEPRFKETEKGIYPVSCAVTVYKVVGGVRCPFTAAAFWNEYYPGDGKHGFFWRKMPHGQLAKCAEALALRKAFPAELSGLYTNEEMQQAEIVTDYQSVTVEEPKAEQPKAEQPKKKVYPPRIAIVMNLMTEHADKIPEAIKEEFRQIVWKNVELTESELADWKDKVNKEIGGNGGRA
jgi:phage recombination protein Bet